MHDGIPHVPHDWAMRRGGGPGPHPRFASADFGPGKHPGFLGLPSKATTHGGIRRSGGPLATPGGKGSIRPGGPTAPSSHKGPMPAATDRRAQLAQERAKMEGQRHQMPQAKYGAGHEGARPEKSLTAKPGAPHVPQAPQGPFSGKGKSLYPDMERPGHNLPHPRSGPFVPPPRGGGKSLVQPPGQQPKTAGDFKRERDEREKARLNTLKEKQGTVPGPYAKPSGPGTPQPGGGRMNPASPQGTRGPNQPGGPGVPRGPRTPGYGGQSAGGPKSPAPTGGFGLKPGSGTGPGPRGGGQPMQPGGASQVRPTKPTFQPQVQRGGGGGGGGAKKAPAAAKKK